MARLFANGAHPLWSKCMFFFFNNRMGCLRSVLISVALTVLLLVVFGFVRF